MLDALKERNRLVEDLREARTRIEAQEKEIGTLHDAVRARNEVLALMAEALIEAGMWIDPIMQGPLTRTGEETRQQLQEKIEQALYLGGFSQKKEKVVKNWAEARRASSG
jgi:hypothetical protein